MAAALALLLAVSALLTPGVQMTNHDLVFLEVNSEHSEEDLSRNFQDRLIIRKGLSGKEVGTSKFFAVLSEADLAMMKLKDAKETTPVKKAEEMMAELKLSWPLNQDINNTNLYLLKISPSLKGKTFQQYQAEIKQGARTLAPIFKTFPIRAYVSKGSFPPTYYVFINIKEEISESFKNSLDIFGGPGSTKVETSYVRIMLFPL